MLCRSESGETFPLSSVVFVSSPLSSVVFVGSLSTFLQISEEQRAAIIAKWGSVYTSEIGEVFPLSSVVCCMQKGEKIFAAGVWDCMFKISTETRAAIETAWNVEAIV